MTERVNRPTALVVRFILKRLLYLPTLWRWGFEVVGGERLPGRRRPLIVTSNHAARIDTLFLIQALRPRFTVCGAHPRYFRTGALRLLMADAKILSVDDHESFLADCRALLDSGEILLIYPEFGRRPDGLGSFSTWPAELALQAGVPLLPCYLYGTTRGHEGRVRLFVGHEIEPRGEATELTERLRRETSALEPTASRPEAA